MSWLRIDDRMLVHPKVRALSNPQFRVWMRMLCACSQHDDPTVDDGLVAEVKDLGSSTLARFVEVGLLDVTPDGYRVHNWSNYRPKDATAADRMRRYREQDRNSDRNETRNAHRNATVSRARGPVPVSPLGGSSDVDLEAEPLPLLSRETLPFTITPEDRANQRKADPVLALLDTLPDADAHTETILRALRLPEGAYRNAAEETHRRAGGAKLAVTILKRIKAELEQPAEAEPGDAFHAYDPPADPVEAIRTQIQNGGIPDHLYLEAELTALGINGAQADELRALLPAETPA